MTPKSQARPKHSSCCRLLLLALALVLLACGTADLQKPIQQFQDASNVVISGSRAMLNQVNAVEQNAAIDKAAFEAGPIDLEQVRKLELVSSQDIGVRTKALGELSNYISSLASLASGKGNDAIATQTDNFSKSLGTLAKNASALPVSKASFIKNAEFGNGLQLAATAFGTVARMLAEHKARAEIVKSIADTQAPIDSLINQLSAELSGAYARQKTTLDFQQISLATLYKREIAKAQPDGNKLMILGDRIKSYLQQESTLAAANPEASINAMRNAHDALVKYVKTNHDPKSLKELLDAAQSFVNEVKSFGDALQSYLTKK
jgi:hypothetical protein